MSSVHQYYPNFYSGFEPETHEFETVEQLLEVHFVKHWATHPQHHRYVKSVYRTDLRDGFHCEALLMVEQEGGARWWVVAYLGDAAIDLPEWVDPGGKVPEQWVAQ